jgi:pyrimidine operon attenuation protein/uracil phosphoribosyltransferase
MNPSPALPDANALLDRLVNDVRVRIALRSRDEPLMIGIQTGGLWVAEALALRLGLGAPVGRLDIGFYRDDFARSGLAAAQPPTQLPWPIEGRHVLLVDDVLYTGRTIRAAINEIFDYGRPASITLAVLVARDGRELPIEADVCGAQMALPAGSSLKLRGPDPLRLELVQPNAQVRNA